jgi:hypothetical protein
MNSSFHIPITLLLIVLLAACHSQQQLSNNTSLRLAVHIKGCAAEGANKSIATTTDTVMLSKSNPFMIIGDTLYYRRTIKHLCCRKVRVTGTLQGNAVVVEEKWYGLGCKCQCISTVEAAVTHLKPGTYSALVIETGTDPLTDKPQSARDTVWTSSVEIK